jgi:nucleotide-binding universal stress UspA family protein
VADGLLRPSSVPVLLVRPREEDEEVVVQLPDVDAILVSLDGTTDSEAALDHAKAAARAFDADLHLVQVVTYPSEVASPYLPQTVALNRELLERSQEEAEGHLETTAAALRDEGLRVERHVLEDVHGAGGIVRTAKEVGADLLVMATHGRSGIRRALLGSVTDKVVRASDTPVLVVRIPHDD